MSKKQKPRKPPKRKPAKPQLDDDLRELAEVLDEHRLDNNAAGWFTLPWNNGWNAVALAVAMNAEVCDWTSGDICVLLVNALAARNKSPEIYWRIAELLTEHGPSFRNDVAWQFQYAGLRCLQVLASNSDGGGSVYNTILRRAFEAYGEDDHAERLTLKHRCNDALGLGPNFEKHFAKEMRAFEIAWKRGLYHAAYSIKPADIRSIQTTMTFSYAYAGPQATIPTLNPNPGSTIPTPKDLSK